SCAKNSCLASDRDLRAPNSGLLSENLANRLGVGHQRVSGKLQAVDRTLGGFFVARAARVSDEHRDIAKIGPVARCRFDSNLGRYADDNERIDAAISKSEVEPRAFESRHRQLVEYSVSSTR